MDRTERVVRDARRRLTVGALIDGAGHGLAWGAAAALVAVGTGKIVALPWHWWWFASAPILIGGAVGFLLALRRRRSMLNAASEVDQRLRLKDRLSTATAFASATAGTPSGVFRSLAVQDADARSAGIDPRRAVPLIWGRAWRIWPALTLLAVCLGVWSPSHRLRRGR